MFWLIGYITGYIVLIAVSLYLIGRYGDKTEDDIGLLYFFLLFWPILVVVIPVIFVLTKISNIIILLGEKYRK